MQIFIYCKVTLHVSGVTLTAASGTDHNIGASTSLQRGQLRTAVLIWPCWREVAATISIPIPERIIL